MTRSRAPLLTALLLAVVARPALAAEPPLRLWYEKPAAAWVEALPIGNGRLGAMVFGRPAPRARWPSTRTRCGPAARRSGTTPTRRPGCRRCARRSSRAATPRPTPSRRRCRGRTTSPTSRSATSSSTSTCPARSRATVASSISIARSPPRPSAPAVRSTPARRSRASPTRSIVLRVSADRPGQVSFTARLDSKLRHATVAEGADAIALRGRAPSHVDPSYLGETKAPVRYDEGPDAEGMRFTAIVKAAVRGGAVRTTPEGRLEVKGADEAVLFVSAATSFNGFDRSPGREGRDADAAARGPARGGGEAVARPPRRARRRPRAPLRPGAPRPRRAGRRPPDRRAAPRLPPRRGPRARRPRLPVRPLPARRELPPRHPAREPPGHLERGRPPAVELQLDDQHQQRDELLAGGGRRTSPSATSRCCG